MNPGRLYERGDVVLIHLYEGVEFPASLVRLAPVGVQPEI